MSIKPGQMHADEAQRASVVEHARRNRRAPAPGERGSRAPLPAMQASVRRCPAMRSPEAAARRKTKRIKRARGLGGRLAAAIRLARLRASRAAEDVAGAKR